MKIMAIYEGELYQVAMLDMWGDPDQATCDLVNLDEEKYGLYLNEVEIIEPTLNPLLGELIRMAEKVEYMHNFQHERFDIVEYIYKTHEIIKLLKEG